MNGFQQSLIRFMYVALALLLVLAAWSMLRPSGQRPASAQWDPSRGPQGVTATGTCIVRTKPELVQVDIGVSQSSPTASAAKGYVKATIRKIVAVLTLGGIAAKDIQTQHFHLASQWDSGRGWQVKKWSAEEALRVRIKDMDRAADLIDAAVKAGANRVGALQYTVEDVNKLRAKGRAKAADVARKKANELANALGGKLGKLVACHEDYPGDYGSYGGYYGWNNGYGGYGYYAGAARAAQANVEAPSSAPDTTPSEEITLQPGEMVVTVLVTATYEVE